MQFLCLGYANMSEFDARPEAEKEEVMRACMEQCIPFRETGKIIAEAGLMDFTSARSIRPRNRKASVTDGPFLETKEQLGSFFIVEAGDIDEAVRIASHHPAALFGEQYGFGIEVRPMQHTVKLASD